MALEAPRLSLRCKVLDAGGAKAPCAGISEEGYVEGGLKDSEKLKELAKGELREGERRGNDWTTEQTTERTTERTNNYAYCYTS